MSTFSEILILIGAISGLILLHEFGHFLAARLFKLDVEEFGIGFPPRMLGFWRFRGHIMIGSTLVKIPAGI